MATNTRRPRLLWPLFQVDDYVEFHAARILLLIYRWCPRPIYLTVIEPV